jgi:Polyketide cyclase / dehydrase and lipid transport
MSRSQWHRFYTSKVTAGPEVLFDLIADMPNYGRWLPASEQFADTTDVEPYPVRLGSRYRDGRPGEAGKEWLGSVVGFQRPGSIDFHHLIGVRQLRATVDVHIHYSFEGDGEGTVVTRWLVLDFDMPVVFRPLRSAVTSRFDKENLRTMAAVKQYAEAHAGESDRGRTDQVLLSIIPM